MGIGVISITTNQRREPPIPATVTAANEGLSLSGTTVQLGEPTGTVGNPSQITATRDLPFDINGFLNLITTFIPSSALNLQITPYLINWTFDSGTIQPIFQMLDNTTGSAWDLFYNPADNSWFMGAPGENITIENFTLFNISGGSGTPTAQVDIGGGGNGVGQGQLKFRGPNLLTAPEQGVMEFDLTNLFFTRTAGTRESVLIGNDAAAAPGTTAGVAIANFYGTADTNYLGDPNSWASVNINGTLYKIPLYT